MSRFEISLCASCEVVMWFCTSKNKTMNFTCWEVNLGT